MQMPKSTLHGRLPFLSALSVTVPGAAAGWVDTVEKFGSGNLSLEMILQPAIDLCEKGFPVSELSSRFVGLLFFLSRQYQQFFIDFDQWEAEEHILREASPDFREMLRPDPSVENGVRSPRAGEVMRNLTLANTFRTLAREGKKEFYEGRIA